MSEKALAVVPSKWDDREMVKTLKDTVCKGATESQFTMFVEICKATGLNPFLKEIWFVAGVGVIAGRDGYLRVANEHPMFDGMSTVVERDAQHIPIKATCSVWRKDRSHPITCEAYYNEYKKGSQVWNTYKSAMISKVAEVLALKRSFSINGVVSEEEMGEVAALGPTKQEKIQAAQDIAADKLRQMGVPVSDADKELPLYHPEPADLKPEPDKFAVLKHFGDLKKEFIAAGAEARYYGVLKNFGFAKSNEIKDAQVARKVYAQLKADLIALRLEIADREETQKIYAALVVRHGSDRIDSLIGVMGHGSWEDVPVSQRDQVLEDIAKELV